MHRHLQKVLFGLACAVIGSASVAAPKKTVPLAGSPRAASAKASRFTFVAYGDTRSHPEVHRTIISLIVAQKPEFVLQSGDLVSDGRNPAQWDEFSEITKPLRDAHIAYYPSRGNHDVGSYYQKFVTEPFEAGGNKYYYAFTRHKNHFIVLDEFQDYDPGSAQYQWLEQELIKGQKTAVNTFVLFHESPFSVGPHGPTAEAQRYIHPLFVKYRPRAVFCGHDHLYYRTTRDGVNYLVTGGGGAPLYQPDNASLAIPGDVYVSTYHIIRCEVDGTQLKGTVITPDGKVIDTFIFKP
ncbi:hypothetical protein CCAX7_63760 [Capsulimonas corticalis]|uniref:Uncharacterized protein n=1 Tax=Capsulimonas corticalis TaxID=2219043 RepID=A0A402CX31_9BACT|nr:hypothetical protein CCAX7_63760 [Capsulimonas corticalis]